MIDFTKPLNIAFANDDLISKVVAKFERVLVIGDVHDDPNLDKDRLRRTGQYIVDTLPDVIVLIGDFLTFDSCNSHDKNHTRKGKKKTSIIDDCESGKRAILALMGPVYELQRKQRKKVYKPKLVITLGNHENRFERFINENPEMAGMYERDLVSIFVQAGFEVVQYGKFFVFHDMSYTHTPFNGMGKPFGGVNMGRNIALNLCFNITHGHKHEAYEVITPKVSNGITANAVHVICTGSFLPVGYREDYADLSQNCWTSLLTEQTFIDGKYISTKRICLRELEIMYP